MIIIYILAFLSGAVVGSFLNVCIYRMPRGESIVFPASRFQNCNRLILWYYNIPFVSYTVLRGRCRYCKAKISPRYFIVEGLTACIFTLLLWKFGLRPEFAIYAALFSALTIISFIDIEHWIIPDELSIPGAAIGLILSVAYPALQGEQSRVAAFISSFLGGLFGFASLFILGWLGRIAYKKEAMGGGDLMLLMLIGAFLGWRLTVVTFFAAAVLGALAGVPRLIMKKQETIQYGPFLALAAFIVVFFKSEILMYFPV